MKNQISGLRMARLVIAEYRKEKKSKIAFILKKAISLVFGFGMAVIGVVVHLN
jgi:hypothetical protein